VAGANAPALAPALAIQARICDLRLAHQPALAGVKHLNRLENVLARAEWNDAAIREGLLLDQDGNAIGGVMSNLFIVENGVLLTPDLSHCGVAGVTRDRVMALAAKLGIACRVEMLPLQRALNADELFFVNSLIGLWPVARLATQTWASVPVSMRIRNALAEDDAAPWTT
jgi:4-amino-4-deoxychorismate lyase